MDEADKYKQRLEAIAEKRRLQEEQDRARRDMEDEKLRVQQLKRKSLRDQWLMEGAPLSPTSLEAQGPHSPLWGSQAQEMEKHIDNMQSEKKRLAEEEGMPTEQMENGQTQEAVNVGEAGEETDDDAVVQNGENDTRGLETTEEKAKKNQSPPSHETAPVLTNGEEEAHTKADASQKSSQSTDEPATASENVDMKLEEGSKVAVSEGEPDLVLNVSISNEEEEGTLVMRAERVNVTDEGDDVHEDLTTQGEQLKTLQSEETSLPLSKADQAGGEPVEEAMKTEVAPKMVTQPEKNEATEPTTEAQPATAGGNLEDDVKTNAEGQDKILEDPTSVQVQPPASALEGTPVSSVPVYCQSTLAPEPQAEGAAAASSEGAETAVKVQDPVPLLGQFQEVPLADAQENQKSEAGPEEQEPLLSPSEAPNSHSEPEAANISSSTETRSPNRAEQGEETEARKRKTCQCCSVM